MGLDELGEDFEPVDIEAQGGDRRIRGPFLAPLST